MSKKIMNKTINKAEIFANIQARLDQKKRIIWTTFLIDFVKKEITQNYKAQNIIINNQECKRIKNFTNYVVSVKGDVYRDVPQNYYEMYLYAINPSKLYFHEMSKTGEKKAYRKIKKINSVRVAITDYKRVLHSLPLARLVYSTFKDNSIDLFVNDSYFGYRDGNFLNCNLDNIFITDLIYAHSKLSVESVRKIKKLIRKNEHTLREISERFGVSEMQINRIKTGENWGNGKRKILPRAVPFYISDPKIRRLLSFCDFEKCNNDIKKAFYIIRDEKNAINNKVCGIVSGYKFTKKHKNITRVIQQVDRLNEYFQL